MHRPSIITLTLLPLLAVAAPTSPTSATSPTSVTKRAGGPGYTPLSPNCTVSDPLTSTTYPGNNLTLSSTTALPSARVPTADLTNAQIYQFFLSEDDAQSEDTHFKTCVEQCNGLSGCKSVLLANNVPTPPGYYGTAGGVLSVNCRFYNRTLAKHDFTHGEHGQYTDERVGNILCPTASGTVKSRRSFRG